MTSLQHTLDWQRARLGRITGSRVGDLMSRGRDKDAVFSKTALEYLNTVAAERLIPDYIVDDDDIFAVYLDEVSVTTKTMRIGTEREDEARDLYAETFGMTVTENGCLPHPDLDGFASSPDGLIFVDDSVDIDGCLEIKCPKPATYLDYLANLRTPDDLKRINPVYYWQCQAHMAVTSARWCDFVLYCPYNARPIHRLRIPADPDVTAVLEDRVRLALETVNQIVSRAVSSDTADTSDQSEPSTSTDHLTRLSLQDFNLVIDCLARLSETYTPDKNDNRDINFLRRARVLLRKLKNKQNKKAKQK